MPRLCLRAVSTALQPFLNLPQRALENARTFLRPVLRRKSQELLLRWMDHGWDMPLDFLCVGLHCFRGCRSIPCFFCGFLYDPLLYYETGSKESLHVCNSSEKLVCATFVCNIFVQHFVKHSCAKILKIYVFEFRVPHCFCEAFTAFYVHILCTGFVWSIFVY